MKGGPSYRARAKGLLETQGGVVSLQPACAEPRLDQSGVENQEEEEKGQSWQLGEAVKP